MDQSLLPELYNYCIVKLVIQPILENAIYYGVGHMDEDDDGRIVVSGEKKDNDIYISIEDNGMGMRKEVLENILTDNNKVPKHGSGVGVINVHSRIKLMFGEGYGLTVYSEPAVAMSGCYPNAERIKSRKGIVKNIEHTPRGFIVTAEFDE